MPIEWLPSEDEVQAGFQALADPTRREVLALLGSGGPQSVGAILSQFDISWSGISRHLGVLRAGGLVSATRNGKQVIYDLEHRRLALLAEEIARLGAEERPAVSRPLDELVAAATAESAALQSGYLGSEHLLLALLQSEESLVAQILVGRGATAKMVRETIEHRRSADGPPGTAGMLDEASWVLARAPAEAASLGHGMVGAPALLLAILAYPQERAGNVLRDLGVDLDQLRADLLAELERASAQASTDGRPDLVRTVEQMQDLVDTLRGAIAKENA